MTSSYSVVNELNLSRPHSAEQSRPSGAPSGDGGSAEERASSRRRRLSREVAVVTIGQVAVVVIGFAGLRLLTTLLSVSEFGRLALGLSIATLFQQVTFGPVSTATIRFAGAAADRGGLPPYVAAVDRLFLRGTMFTLAIGGTAGVTAAALGFEEWLGLGAASVLFSIASGGLITRLSIDAALRHRGWVATMHSGSEAARFGAAGLAVWLAGRSAVAAMAGFAAAAFLSTIVQRTRVGASKLTGPDEWTPVLTEFAAPLAATGALTWSQTASDRWSINALLSATHVGAYSVLYQIAVAPFALLGSMILGVMAPIVFRIAGAGTDPTSVRASHLHVKAAVLALGVATATGTLVAWRFHETVFAVLVGPEFGRYSSLLPLGVVAGGLLAAGQVVGTTVLSRGATSELVIPKAVTASLGLVLNIAGAWAYGVIGVLLANVVYGLVFFAWMSVLASGSPRPGTIIHPDR